MPAGPDWLILDGVEPLERTIEPWSPVLARTWFLNRYSALMRALSAAA